MHFHPIPTGVRSHDSGDTLDYGVVVSWHVDFEQPLPINDNVAFINAVLCTTIPNEVLSTCNNLFPAGWVTQLKTLLESE